MTQRLFGAIAGVALTLIANAASGQSQASTGQIGGRVFDASGAVIHGVVVTVVNDGTGIRHEAVTNNDGLYAFSLLPTGTYQLSATLKGFQSVREPGLHVTVGSTLRRDLTLQIGDVSDTVDVEDGASRLDVTSPVASVTFDATAVERMPTNGRRFQDLVVLTPHAQIDTQRGQIAMSGQRGINSNISIDGADYNQPFFGGLRGGSRSNFAPTVPQEAIREFQVVASGYSRVRSLLRRPGQRRYSVRQQSAVRIRLLGNSTRRRWSFIRSDREPRKRSIGPIST